MNWKVKLSSISEKHFRKLDANLRKRLLKELRDLSGLEYPAKHPKVRALTGDLKKYFRLRVGSYRVIFALLNEEKIIAVVNIVPRGDAY
jgi:mRNA interferase RelE/StbE